MALQRILIALALSAILLAGCANSANNLAGTTWRLDALGDQPPIPGTEITLVFETDSLEGRAGCNRYGGNYAIQNNTLTLQDIFATEMGCLEPAAVLEQEQAYLAALRAVSGYRIDGDRLEMTDRTGALVLTFSALADG